MSKDILDNNIDTTTESTTSDLSPVVDDFDNLFDDSHGSDIAKEPSLVGGDNLPIPPAPTTVDDMYDEPDIDFSQRVADAMANAPKEQCYRNLSIEKKLLNFSTYIAAGLFLVAIIITLFDAAKYRSPWAFLFLSLASATQGIFAILRFSNNNKCKCSVCHTQASTFKSSAFIWLTVALGTFIAFIVFLVINMK